MATQYHKPSLAASNPAAVYAFKEFLKGLGWTVPVSGDGSATYNSSGDCITSGTVLATAKAHFEMVAPDGSAAWSYQTGSSSNTARVKITWGNGFGAGSPSATQVRATASAADEAVLLGGGTDAVPTYGTAFAGVGGNQNCYASAADVAPYGFVFFATRTTGLNGLDMLFMFDPTVSTARNALDTAPSLFYWNGSSGAAGAIAQLENTTTGAYGWIGKGIAGGAIVDIPVSEMRDGSAIDVPGGLNRDYYDGYGELFSMTYQRRASLANPDGFKGASSQVRLIGSTETTGTRLTDDLGRKWVVGNNLAIPWDGTAIANDPSAGATLLVHDRFSINSPDIAPPVITFVSPTPGVIPGTRDVARQTDVVVDVTGAGSGLFVLFCAYDSEVQTDVIHNGTDFVAPFSGSTSVITGGTRYTFKDSRGWQSNFTVTAKAIDEAGNVAT